MSTPDSTTRKVARIIKKFRLERDFTQEDVASRAKISPNYYSKIERGDVRPSIEMYEKIAKALKVGASDIFPF